MFITFVPVKTQIGFFRACLAKRTILPDKFIDRLRLSQRIHRHVNRDDEFSCEFKRKMDIFFYLLACFKLWYPLLLSNKLIGIVHHSCLHKFYRWWNDKKYSKTIRCTSRRYQLILNLLLINENAHHTMFYCSLTMPALIDSEIWNLFWRVVEEGRLESFVFRCNYCSHEHQKDAMKYLL